MVWTSLHQENIRFPQGAEGEIVWRCRITPNSSDSNKTSDSPSHSASFGLRQGLPPRSPMSGDVTGRMLRASDLVRTSSSRKPCNSCVGTGNATSASAGD